MKNFDWSRILPIAIIALFVLAIIAIVVIDASNQDDRADMKYQLLNFCTSQLRDEVDNCIEWRDTFVDLYGDEPAECLDAFDSDSALLLMCLDNIVAGR